METFTEIENNSGEGEGDKYGSSGRGENEKLESFLDPKWWPNLWCEDTITTITLVNYHYNY